MSCSSDESEGSSENEGPDQEAKQVASKKVRRSDFALWVLTHLHLLAMLIALRPQASPGHRTKKRKASDKPSSSSLDAPLLG